MAAMTSASLLPARVVTTSVSLASSCAQLREGGAFDDGERLEDNASLLEKIDDRGGARRERGIS
jgi:hypothetical protein